MAIAHHHEREVTYAVDADWVRPALDAVVSPGGRQEGTTHELEAVYYDTDPPLLRPMGITLRRRRGGTDAGWHLKIPAGEGRTEVQSRSTGSSIPSAIARRVVGIAAGRSLRAVATISTTRYALQTLDASGALVTEVADDRVRGWPAGAESDVVAWREVEVELGDAGREADLAAVAGLLEAAGARLAGQQRKINHVLGEPDDLDVAGMAGVTRLVASSVRAQCREILLGDVRLRDAPTAAAVHETRVAVRRLRSTLGAFPHLFSVPAREVERIDGELRWLASLLSPVRDADVLADRLAAEVDLLPLVDVVGPVREEMLTALDAERKEAVDAWRAVASTERYLLLTAGLGRWWGVSPVDGGAAPHGRRVLRDLGRRARRRRTDARSGTGATDARGLHRARKAAKRLRYAAELLTPEVPRAAAVARKARRRQVAWGEHQDLQVALDFLRRKADPAATPPVESAYTYGVLAARLESEAARIRGQT